MTFTQRSGFVASVGADAWNAAGPESRRPFLKAVRKGKALHCTTAKLLGLNARLKDATADCLEHSRVLLQGCAPPRGAAD